MSATIAFPVAVVIVGAGAGTRFGEPKAFATLADGRTFLETVAQTVRDAGLQRIVAVLPPRDAAKETEAITRGLTIVRNANPKSEQIVSVRLGLTALVSDPSVGALIWPVDHPFPNLMTVLAVIDAAKRTGAPFVVPTFEGRRGHPLYAHRDTWRELLTVADGGARAVVRSYGDRVAEVAVSDAGVLRDIDTRLDLGA
ncbi:MAG: nucleotidyltransferase family protein [Gemmatimonadetes bacterium]|nr:nucleotidyltransferase family protein [Gemmatimonadota bacterium]